MRGSLSIGEDGIMVRALSIWPSPPFKQQAWHAQVGDVTKRDICSIVAFVFCVHARRAFNQ